MAARGTDLTTLESQALQTDKIIAQLSERVSALEVGGGAAGPVSGNVEKPAPRDTEWKSNSQSCDLSVDEKLQMIQRGLDETIGGDEMREIVSKRPLKLYWGTATTGAPHIAYFVPMTKIADFLRAGCEVTILFADLHAYLDNMKSSWEVLQHRTKYYEAIIKAMLKSLGVTLENLRFVKGTDYQLNRNYTLDIYKMTSLVTEHNAKKAGAEVVKQVESPLLSGMLYPLLQALDEEYLGVDAQFGGVDQRKIFTFAQESLPKLGYKKRIHLMNPMVPGLTGDKMSSSEKNSKIDLLDSAPQVKKKINGAFCEEGNVENNGVLSFIKMVLFPLYDLSGMSFKIERKAEFGGDQEYKSFEALKADFAAKKVHPGDLKKAAVREINALMEPIRREFEAKEMQELKANAYPADMEGGKQAPKNAPDKKAKKSSGGGGKAAAPAESAASGGKVKDKGSGAKAGNDASALDLRVGVVKDVVLHPEKAQCYVLQVDIGEAQPRTVVGGFAEAIPPRQVLYAKVVVQANLSASKFKGVSSTGMILAAASDDMKVVELITPPAKCVAGDRVTFPGYDAPLPVPVMNSKKKVFQTSIQPHMRTNNDRVPCFKDSPFTTQHGLCTVASLKGAMIK